MCSFAASARAATDFHLRTSQSITSSVESASTRRWSSKAGYGPLGSSALRSDRRPADLQMADLGYDPLELEFKSLEDGDAVIE